MLIDILSLNSCSKFLFSFKLIVWNFDLFCIMLTLYWNRFDFSCWWRFGFFTHHICDQYTSSTSSSPPAISTLNPFKLRFNWRSELLKRLHAILTLNWCNVFRSSVTELRLFQLGAWLRLCQDIYPLLRLANRSIYIYCVVYLIYLYYLL